MNTITVQPLQTEKSPREVLDRDFPFLDWPISGGWGYDKDDACVIELDRESYGVEFEYRFLEIRSQEELSAMEPLGEGYDGVNIEVKTQKLFSLEGKHYDMLTFTVSALHEKDWELLKEDWHSHNGYEDDPEGRERHLALLESKQVTYDSVAFFDISNFYGRY